MDSSGYGNRPVPQTTPGVQGPAPAPKVGLREQLQKNARPIGPSPIPGVDYAAKAFSNAAGAAMGFVGRTVHDAFHPPGRASVQPAPVAAPATPTAAPVANVPVAAPVVTPPRSAQVAPARPGVGVQGPPPAAPAAVGVRQSPAQAPAAQPAQQAQPAADPYHVAEARLLNQQADAAVAARSGVNDRPRTDQYNAQRLDLFKQYHGGLAPGEHQAADPVRARLVSQVTNPGVNYQGGVAVYGGNAGDGGAGPSVAERNAQVANAATAQLGVYDKNQSDIAAQDPNQQIGLLRQIAADPALKGMYLASKGVDGQTIQSLPSPVPAGQAKYHAANVEAAATDPAVAGLHSILEGDMPIHQKVAVARAIPGIESPTSPHRQLLDAWIARRTANQTQWDQEVAPYGQTDPRHTGVFSNHWFDPSVVARNRQFHADMGRLGYGWTPR